MYVKKFFHGNNNFFARNHIDYKELEMNYTVKKEWLLKHAGNSNCPMKWSQVILSIRLKCAALTIA